METHPVPQNVTSFEFHLVGDMTLKQFIYLAVGLVTAYLTYIFMFEALPWAAVPIIVVSASLGAAFAFLPIQDRPLDHWAGAFFRAIYSPTQRQWKISPKKLQLGMPEDQLFQKRLQVYRQSLRTTPIAPPAPVVQAAPPPQAPQLPLRRMPTPQQQAQPPQQPPAPKARPVFNDQLLNKVSQHAPNVQLPSDEELNKTVELAKEAQIVQNQIITAEKQIKDIKSAAANPGSNPEKYQGDLQNVFSNLQNLIGEAQQLSRQMGANQPHHPNVVKVVEPTVKPKRTIPALTSLPNVISGIVTDSAGNYLESVVVVIHNQDGLPVRALKTNKLGQFTGSTPLPAGTYTVELEKENLEFDTLKVTLNDQIIPSIEIVAKKGAVA